MDTHTLQFKFWPLAPGFDAFRPTAHQHNTSHQKGTHLVKHTQAQIRTDDGVKGL